MQPIVCLRMLHDCCTLFLGDVFATSTVLQKGVHATIARSLVFAVAALACSASCFAVACKACSADCVVEWNAVNAVIALIASCSRAVPPGEGMSAAEREARAIRARAVYERGFRWVPVRLYRWYFL